MAGILLEGRVAGRSTVARRAGCCTRFCRCVVVDCRLVVPKERARRVEVPEGVSVFPLKRRTVVPRDVPNERFPTPVPRVKPRSEALRDGADTPPREKARLE